jgi:hypothetical protein
VGHHDDPVAVSELRGVDYLDLIIHVSAIDENVH